MSNLLRVSQNTTQLKIYLTLLIQILDIVWVHVLGSWLHLWDSPTDEAKPYSSKLIPPEWLFLDPRKFKGYDISKCPSNTTNFSIKLLFAATVGVLLQEHSCYPMRAVHPGCRSSALSVYTLFSIQFWTSYLREHVDVLPTAEIDVSDQKITLFLSAPFRQL